MIQSSDILNARILIVDDQEANVLLLERILRCAGYRSVTSTMDPHAVYELNFKNRYSLILLDLQMPGMDGFEVMEGLKVIETDGYLPVLVLTAQPDHKLRALKAGAKDFVSQPFDLAEVLMRVYNMLEVRLLHLETRKLYDQVTTANQELTQALSEVKVLRGILPICSYCKKIRDDKDYWQSVEKYISKRTDALFSHGFCPECYTIHVQPQLDALKKPENSGT
jgi:CheY-like chemotaxis protein